ncbi:MAG: class I mannose-6-phosphate isomerase [Niabella sp.]|nr:class I mannose-6-phosphate isomerase [Niabella sp.]
MTGYNKKPEIKIEGFIQQGWEPVLEVVEAALGSKGTLIVECYTGVNAAELTAQLKKMPHALFIDTVSLFKTEAVIRELTQPFVTDDILFGQMTALTMDDYFDPEKLIAARKKIAAQEGRVIVFGCGADVVTKGGLTIYADMPRWELQLRMRKMEGSGLGVDDREEYISVRYKRGLFNDWKILDHHKQTLYNRVDYWLDTTVQMLPRMIDKATFFAGMEKAVSGPFRVVPFFDPAPWGGQWMKAVCDLDRSVVNYGWCFDCVPEENSLLFNVWGVPFETPAINLVLLKSQELLGAAILKEFGKEFPIRFDFLDTMEGGNLSLQVHPTKAFAKKEFGIDYTQEESYYLMDAKDDAYVYLGLKTGIDKEQMLGELETAQEGNGYLFDADKYVNRIPAKKHDHFCIPPGTIHCSGKNSMVLEISATPFIYTFKLWDWNRLGLDGRPRPVNINRGKEVINWQRDTAVTNSELVNRFTVITSGEGWMEERTGLHETQFIETRRYTFTKEVVHETNGTLNVLNLVDGEAIVVESEAGEFDPFVVHYAETFIVPARVKKYSIKPHGNSVGKECKTIKAFVKPGFFNR